MRCKASCLVLGLNGSPPWQEGEGGCGDKWINEKLWSHQSTSTTSTTRTLLRDGFTGVPSASRIFLPFLQPYPYKAHLLMPRVRLFKSSPYFEFFYLLFFYSSVLLFLSSSIFNILPFFMIIRYHLSIQCISSSSIMLSISATRLLCTKVLSKRLQ